MTKTEKAEAIAQVRMMILGSLISRNNLERGEIKQLTKEAAKREYDMPGLGPRRFSRKTIEGWYYSYQRGGFDALLPKKRDDAGTSKLDPTMQTEILRLKQEQPRRSIDRIIEMMVSTQRVAMGDLSRSAVHRLLKAHGISRMTGSASMPEEFRSYVCEHAGEIWYGDVMHGPSVLVNGRMQKVYLVSLMDDASRLIVHTAFCTGETALDIEGVLKQAVLKRGLPSKMVLDNGAAYRSRSLQGICARLGIHVIYCRPYAPEGKGKLERFHRTFRDQFLCELDKSRLSDLGDLNARLWAWIEHVYHQRIHSALNGQSPLSRYQQDLPRIRSLGTKAATLDELFYHRDSRKVRRDGTVAWHGRRFEVPYELAGKQIQLVYDPHEETPIRVEDNEGVMLGAVTPLDAIANCHRKRHKPEASEQPLPPMKENMVDIATEQYYGSKKRDK